MDIPMYELTEIPPLPGFQSCELTAINTLNDRVMVVGYSTSDDLGLDPGGTVKSAFLWVQVFGEAPEVTTLDLVDGRSNQALGINNTLPATVVGWESSDTVTPHPVYWTQEGPHPWSGIVGQLRGINKDGYKVGWKKLIPQGVTHAIVMTPDNQFIDLFPGAGSEQWSADAWAINEKGMTVGWSTFPDGVRQATMWDLGDHYQNLGNPTIYSPMAMSAAVGVTSVAYAINAGGDIVVAATKPDGYTSAFQTNQFAMRVWPDPGDPGNPPKYGFSAGDSPTIPHGINDSQLIVADGSTVSPQSAVTDRRAFVCVAGTDAVAADLNVRLAASGAGWNLLQANGINGRGQITGFGVAPNGQFHGYLLTPA